MLRKCLSLVRFSVKEKAFTLQNNLKVCLSTQFDLSLINMVFEGYLNDKVYDEISHTPQQENQMVIQQINQILMKEQKDHELVTNLIYYFESIQGIDNHNENARQLMDLAFDEYSSIALLIFYSEKEELFNEFKVKLGSLTLLQKLIIQSCENEEINLSKTDIQELYKYQDKLRSYALLFISKYEQITEEIQHPCLPQILLMQKHQCDYILKQYLLQIRTIPLLQLGKLLQQLQKFQNSELLKQFAKILYVERIEIKQNKFFDRRILKYFIDLLSKCECFEDYHVHANLISRYINLQPNKWESPMRSIYIDLRRLAAKDIQVYTKFQQLFLTPQYINSITYLELYLSQKITAEQVFIIQLLKLRVPEDYYHRFLKEIEPNKKYVKALVKCICMNPYVWQTDTITEDIKILFSWIDEYPYDYLIYIDLQNRPASVFVQQLINQSSYKSLYKFIRLNYYYIKNNTEVKLTFPQKFIEKVYEEMINLMENQGNKNEMESFNIENLIRIYDAIGIFDDNLKQQIERYILTQQSSQVTQILRSSEQLRKLLLNSVCLNNSNDRYVNIMLNKTINIKDSIITSIQDILDAHSKGLLLSGFEQKQLKQNLIAKLQTIKEIPTSQQAYELVMGFKYTDFDQKMYLTFLAQIKNKFDSYDYHHIHKLITKLTDNKLIHAGIFYKCYLKLQRTFQSQLKDQKNTIYILKLALLMKRLNSDIQFQMCHQESEEGIFIQQIIQAIHGQKCKQIKFDQAWTLKYIEFYPFFYDDFKQFETFKDKLQVALPAYVRGHRFELDVSDIQKELNKPAYKLLVQLQLACLISMFPTRDTQSLEKLKSNLLHIDPETNHLLQDQQVILFTVLKDLYPTDSINRRFEILVKQEMSNFQLPTIKYFLTDSLLTIRIISQMEEICLN